MIMKDWKTDIKIKLPRIHIIRPKHYNDVSEEIIKSYLKLSFLISPLALWKAWELIKLLINNLT